MNPSEMNINLYPERRQQGRSLANSNETSRYFAPSRQSGQRENSERTEKEAESSSSPPQTKQARGRQTVLNFSNGTLGTKVPLKNPTPRTDAARMSLADVATQTISLLPGLLATRPDVGTKSFLYQPQDLPHMRSSACPDHPPTTIRVIDADTIDAALAIQSNSTQSSPVCILNMANATHAGGGFKHGALAQEEALCYRSSLIFTLKLRFYPIPEDGAIFSPSVLIIRESMSTGHDLLDFRNPALLPVISVVSAAAICQPRLTRDTGGRHTYANNRDREFMLRKMRNVLRVCMKNGCTRVVLGAFGCGAFANPASEVAQMWKSVLEEKEFAGWWEDLVFAVLDGKRDDNFTVFKMVLDGLQV